MSRKRQNVLDEDSYLRSIDALVERQFFPDNEMLALENAYLEAEQQNDLETMKNLTIRRKELELAKTPVTSIRDRHGKDYIPATPGSHTGSLSNKQPTPREQVSKIKEDGTIKTEAEIAEEELKIYQKEMEDLDSEDFMINHTVTLNGFLSKNTSEDNHQYHKIQRDIDAKKHLAKYRWVYELDNKHRKFVPYATADAGLGISAKKKLQEQQKTMALEYKEELADKQLPLIPVGVAKDSEVKDIDRKDDEGNEAPIIRDNKIVRKDASLYEKPDDRDSSKIINNWRYISKNNVMFYREAIGSKYDDGKFKKPMQINYEATRFKDKDPYAVQLERMRIQKASERAQMFKAGQVQKDGSSVNQDGSWTPGTGISSTGTPGRTPARITPGISMTGTPLGVTKFSVGGMTPKTARAGSAAAGTTPAGSEFSGFVPNTPSITPGTGPDESPLMTWGTLGTTPVALTPRIGLESDCGSRYKLPGVLKRELVAEKLLDKVKSRDRMKKNKVMDKAKKSIFGDTPDRLGSVLGGSTSARLTPQASILARKTIAGLRTGSRRSGSTPLVRLTGSKRKQAATPTPGPGQSMIAAKLSKLTGDKVTSNLL